MMRLPRPALVALIMTLAGSAQAQDIARSEGQDDLAFARSALALRPGTEPQVTSAEWNGALTLFVDYVTAGEHGERVVVALQRQPSGDYRRLDVTLGEQEGGTPALLALGFANADSDPAKELIVILAWHVGHYDVRGTAYEVRILDDPKPLEGKLAPLQITDEFDWACDCSWRDGSIKSAPFKTIAAVKAELKRLGF